MTGAGADGDMMDAAKALSVENFDAAKVTEIIDASELNDMVKTTLKAAVSSAQENPELVSGVVDQVKAALGL
jgi:hypothetical protein